MLKLKLKLKINKFMKLIYNQHKKIINHYSQNNLILKMKLKKKNKKK